MALGSTVYTFDIGLADMDRGVYETLAMRVACHPSETLEFLVTRVLAYCLEHAPGIEFSRGLCEPDEPAVWVRDPTGRVTTWIEVGAPSAERLHRASKAAERVVVYTHRDPGAVLRALAGRPIHRRERIALRAFDRAFLDALVARVERRTSWELSVTEGELFARVGDADLRGAMEEQGLGVA